jgi:hypothetical protein
MPFISFLTVTDAFSVFLLTLYQNFPSGKSSFCPHTVNQDTALVSNLALDACLVTCCWPALCPFNA